MSLTRKEPRLREHFTFTRSLGFFVLYFAVQIMLCIYGVVSLGPLAFVDRNGWAAPVDLLYGYYLFWHGKPGELSLLPTLMSVNCLAAVYLWVEFRRYRHSPERRGIAPHAYFIGCAIALMTFQYLYMTLSLPSPPRLIPLDLTTPVAIP